MIGVRNKSGKKLVGRFDGKDIVFEADEKVTTPVSEDAARHIFGYGERDKTRALLRLGWIANGGAPDEALDRLGQFQFLAVEDVKFKEMEADTTLHLPRSVASGPAQDVPLSAEEKALLNKPEGATKQFAKR